MILQKKTFSQRGSYQQLENCTEWKTVKEKKERNSIEEETSEIKLNVAGPVSIVVKVNDLNSQNTQGLKIVFDYVDVSFFFG